MKTKYILMIFGLALSLCNPAFWAVPAKAADGEIERWFRGRQLPTAETVVRMRSEGAPGLARIFTEYDSLRTTLHSNEEERKLDTWMDRWVNAVCAQHLCRYSKMFWYTDFSTALAQARKEGKPLLRLRLLGNLSDELSCANSRFFKTLVYPDPRVRDLLRSHYILLWESERPVPRVSVQLGDGRSLESTLTGNSVHYVLDAQGRIVDAIPGLYHPRDFADRLKEDEAFTKDSANLPEQEFLAALYTFHNAKLSELDKRWDSLLSADAPKGARRPTRREIETKELRQKETDAGTASTRAVTKNLAQLPILNVVRSREEDPLDTLNHDSLWKTLAEHYRAAEGEGEGPIIKESRVLIESEMYPLAETAPDYRRMYAQLRQTLSLDTVRNEFILHGQIHRWLMSSNTPIDFKLLNTRIYRELFLSPQDDPWMGLLKNDAFTGVRNAGAVVVREKD